MVWLLWTAMAQALAAAPAPEAEAMISPDGAFVLRLSPAQSWTSAEVSVVGATGEDVGAREAGAAFSVEGDLETPGTLWVTVNAALGDAHGVSWVFSVDPQVVPMKSPRMTRLKAEPRRCRLLWWRE